MLQQHGNVRNQLLNDLHRQHEQRADQADVKRHHNPAQREKRPTQTPKPPIGTGVPEPASIALLDHRLRRRAEQQIVDDRLVLPGDVRNLGRKREDDMEVADRQQVGFAFGQPAVSGGALAFGTVPVTTANLSYSRHGRDSLAGVA